MLSLLFQDRNQTAKLGLFIMLLASLPTFGQANQNNFNGSAPIGLYASGAPTGTCPGSNVYYTNSANGDFYDCPASGTWTKVNGSGGGGTVTSVSGTANQIASTGGATPVLSITDPFIFPGEATFAPSDTGDSGINIPRGTPPTTPATDDFWNAAGVLFLFDGTTNQQVLYLSTANAAYVPINGAGGTPTSLTLTNATGLPLNSGVSGILPIANGGTNAATFAANKWFGNNTSSTAAPAVSSIGTSDTSVNWYAADSGAVNAYVVTLPVLPVAYATGMIACFKASAANTVNNPTVNFTGPSGLLGAKTITRLNGNVLSATADIGTTGPACVIYDGTNFELLNPAGFTGTGSIALANAPTFATKITTPLFVTSTKCAQVGSGANPSVAACAAAPAGVFSCAVLSVGNCQVNTTAMINANSTVLVWQDASTLTGTLLGVTCNTTISAVNPVITAKVAATSFSFQITTPITNPDCFQYLIVN
jgi:hypothetical protein